MDASRLFHIGTRLFKGQRKMIEGHHELSAAVDLLLVGRRAQPLGSTQQQLRSLHKAHLFHRDGRGQ